MTASDVSVPAVVDELTAVLRELIGDDVDLDGDPVVLVAALERAADGVPGRNPLEVARLLARLDAVLALGRATVEQVSSGQHGAR